MSEHSDTIRTPPHQIAAQLVDSLGPTLVATLAGVRDRKLPYRWRQDDGPIPRDSALSRLQAAHQVWRVVSTSDGDSIARAWFIGVNPLLGDVQPCIALRDGRLGEVLSAARSFADGNDAT